MCGCCNRMREICSSDLLLVMLWLWMLGAASPAKIHGYPANDQVALVNANRTVSKLPWLRNSAGLGCMALQYISECMGNNGGGDSCGGDNMMVCESL